MERRIKLSNDDLKTISEVLYDAAGAVREGMKDVDECELAEQGAHMGNLDRLAEEFASRVEEDENEDPENLQETLDTINESFGGDANYRVAQPGSDNWLILYDGDNEVMQGYYEQVADRLRDIAKKAEQRRRFTQPLD